MRELSVHTFHSGDKIQIMNLEMDMRQEDIGM